MASKIVPLIPPHTVYCEPFAGGAAILFAKPTPKTSDPANYREALNDLSHDLITMYAQARDNLFFPDAVKATPFSAYWTNWAHMVLLSNRKDALSRAVAKFVAHRQGFAGNPGGAWSRATISTNHAANWQSNIKDIKEKCERIKHCFLDCVDAISCIEKWDSPQTFFYVDPPYLGTHLGHMGTWRHDDLRRLVSCLNMTKGSFIVSGYDTHMQHLRGCKTISFDSSCTANGEGRVKSSKNQQEFVRTKNQERKEVLWMRGPAAAVRSSLIPVLQKQTCFAGPLLGPCPLPLQR